MNGLAAAVLMLALMALASGAATWYFKQLRKDQADPVTNSALPTVMRPAPHHLPETDPNDDASLFVDRGGRAECVPEDRW